MFYLIGGVALVVSTLITAGVFRSRKSVGRMQFTAELVIVVMVVVAVSVGCSPQGGMPAASESERVVVSTVPASEIVVEPPADPVLAEARSLCDGAFSSPLATDVSAPAPPARWLTKREYENELWTQPTGDTEGVTMPDGSWVGPEPNTLVCILEGREVAGRYEGGGPAFRRIWTTRVVSCEDGTVLVEQVFQGGDPPIVTLCPEGVTECPGYGPEPEQALRDWLEELIELGPRGQIQGVLVDKTTGVPIQGGPELSCIFQGTESEAERAEIQECLNIGEVVIDRSGGFLFLRVPPGEYALINDGIVVLSVVVSPGETVDLGEVEVEQ